MRNKIHLSDALYRHSSFCGIEVDGEQKTFDIDSVTCRTCAKLLNLRHSIAYNYLAVQWRYCESKANQYSAMRDQVANLIHKRPKSEFPTKPKNKGA